MELVEIETYLRSEGILVRYWYPLEMLERPAPGYRKSSFIVGRHKTLDVSNIDIHKFVLFLSSSFSSFFSCPSYSSSSSSPSSSSSFSYSTSSSTSSSSSSSFSSSSLFPLPPLLCPVLKTDIMQISER